MIFRSAARVVTLLLAAIVVAAGFGAWMAFGALTTGGLTAAASSPAAGTVALSAVGGSTSTVPCPSPGGEPAAS
jgi:hypothetical protein